MSDNIPINTGSGAVVATRDIGAGVESQRVIPISWDGTNAIDLDGAHTKLEYYTPAGSTSNQVRFMGYAPQSTLTSAAGWTVRQLTWTHLSDGDHLTDLQTLAGTWDGRATLPWT